MVDLDIIEQKPVTMALLKDKLDLAKKDKELNFRAAKVYTYLQDFVSLKKEEADVMYTKLSGLGISKLRDKQIVKIIDIMPQDADTLKSLFAGDTVSLKQEEIKQILDAING